jgi:hypothetical protein
MTTDRREQQHPLYGGDRQIVNTILAGEPTDLNLAELARLKIRYRGFPGARDIQKDLDKTLANWKLTEEQLFDKTRELHNSMRLYTVRARREQEDWS